MEDRAIHQTERSWIIGVRLSDGCFRVASEGGVDGGMGERYGIHMRASLQIPETTETEAE
jgi:hypothetical protein